MGLMKIARLQAVNSLNLSLLELHFLILTYLLKRGKEYYEET